MATLDDSLQPAPPAAPPAKPSPFWDRVDAVSAWASEFINPILVKETRQALKSRQFLITFGLLLLAGWLWSMSVILWGPGVYYGASGMQVFAGYFWILCFPLIVVIPFGAYRSLAAEWEDGTYDLMSISTLSARQIVTGKLGSAMVQMMVYLSAIVPCLAFTYLLRGVDLITIFYLLFWLCMNSLLATFLALAMATITRQRVWQVFVSVVLIAISLFNFTMSFPMVSSLAFWGELAFDDPYLWIGTAAMLTGVVGYCAFFLLIARARLMFPSENRSTALRVTMLLHFAAFAAWWGWAWVYEFNFHPIPALMFVMFTGIHWYVMGIFMTCEAAELSPRVKRDLPQSFLGRVFLTWFNPGSGTGYVFAVANTVAAAGLMMAALAAKEATLIAQGVWRARYVDGAYYGAVVITCYLIIYLGIGRLLIRALRRTFALNMFGGVVLQIGLFAAGNLLPLLLQAAVTGEIDDDQYTLLQTPAPIWTLIVAIEYPNMVEVPVVTLILVMLALIVFACNLPGAAAEAEQFRIAKPKRVEEDDAELRPPPEPQPSSPWD